MNLKNYEKIILYNNINNFKKFNYNKIKFKNKFFVRFCENTFNYYEYEIPIKYINNNQIEIKTEDIIYVKKNRNNKKIKKNELYKLKIKNFSIHIRGKPSIKKIRKIIIGIKNIDKKKKHTKNTLLMKLK